MKKTGFRMAQELTVASPPKRREGRPAAVAPAGPRLVPESEVPANATRCRFPTDYKLSILRQADASRQAGEIGTLLRRAGLYSSHLTLWRRQRAVLHLLHSERFVDRAPQEICATLHEDGINHCSVRTMYRIL